MTRRIDRIRSVFVSPSFMFLSAALAMLGVLLGETWRMPCMIANAMLLSLILCLSDDLSAIFMPFMGVMVDGTQYFGSWTDILAYLPWAIPIVFAFLFHFIVYRKPLSLGLSGKGNVAVATALLLGGFGVVSTADLFQAEGLYHYLMLSVGMLLVYILLYSNVKPDKTYNIYHHFLWCLFYVGLSCSIIVFYFLVSHFLSEDASDIAEYLSRVYSRNSISPLLIMALPAPFAFAKRQDAWYARLTSFSFGLFFYVALMLTGARTALLFGTILFLCCLVYFFWGRRDVPMKLTAAVLLLVAVCVAGNFVWDTIGRILEKRLGDNMLISSEDIRYDLWLRSWDNFLQFPLFGIGVSSNMNIDLMTAPEGSILWYHLYYPQIWGSMGILGMVAYTYRAGLRLRLCLCKPTWETIAISLGALGIFLYSQTDPGEFIPIPYGIMMVFAFALLDRHYEEENKLFCNKL